MKDSRKQQYSNGRSGVGGKLMNKLRGKIDLPNNQIRDVNLVNLQNNKSTICYEEDRSPN